MAEGLGFEVEVLLVGGIGVGVWVCWGWRPDGVAEVDTVDEVGEEGAVPGGDDGGSIFGGEEGGAEAEEVGGESGCDE